MKKIIGISTFLFISIFYVNSSLAKQVGICGNTKIFSTQLFHKGEDGKPYPIFIAKHVNGSQERITGWECNASGGKFYKIKGLR